MRDRQLARIFMHVGAIAAATACWHLLAEFAEAWAASVAAFLAVNGLGHVAFGPMPTADELRRDVQRILDERE